MTETKTLTTYMVVNWKDESLRTRKTEPSAREKSPYEFVMPVEIDVHVPETDTPTLNATVDIPGVAVEAGMRAEDAEHVAPEDWQGVADELIAGHAENGGEYDFQSVYALTGQVLNEVDVYPDPTEVKQYVSSEYGRLLRERDAA